MSDQAILLISSPDRKGITAAVTGFVFEHNGNIVHADQHIDEHSNTFFMRIQWDLDGFDIAAGAIAAAFAPLAERCAMTWKLFFTRDVPRVAIFVSKPQHCLYDLLIRHESGELPCEIPLVISNHADASAVSEKFGIRFCHFPVTPDNKARQEEEEMALLQAEKIDLVVLARYHQILTQHFVSAYTNSIINIHHSFLPAFVGKSPYLQAYERGVKIIGATSHFVTEALDEGPIIEQDTVRISHRNNWRDLERKGRDLEKIVLHRAVRLFLEHKVLCYGNKTVVFD